MSAAILQFPNKNHTVSVDKTDDEWFDGIKKPTNRVEFLAVCKMALTDDDYREILCGIMDPDIYDDAEKYIKGVVDAYYSFPQIKG